VGSDFASLAGVDEGLPKATLGYPDVPEGQTRLEAQTNACPAAQDLVSAVDGIGEVASKVGVL
jgi:hypothetical protein